jgi:thymidylate kinase
MPIIIVIEGLDGVGKTATAKALKHELIKHGFETVLHELEDIPFYSLFQELRHLSNSNTKYLLQLASLSYKCKIVSTYPKNTIAIFDRYLYSVNAVYGAISENIRSIDPIEFPVLEPTIKVLLTCSSLNRKNRLINRGEKISNRKLSTLDKYGDKIGSILLSYPDWLIIDNNFKSISDCVNIIIKNLLIEERLKTHV